MGIVCDRRRKARQRHMRRRWMIAAGVLALGSMAMAPQLRKEITVLGRQLTPVFAQEAQMELTLPQREIYALQLGVFDSGERAASEVQRLTQTGVKCLVWQRDKMRIISGVALSREKLLASGTGGHEAYVIKDVMPKVTVRISCDARRLEEVRRMLETPDAILMHLLTGEAASLEALVEETGDCAQCALHAHPEHALFTELAQSLANWCALMERTMESETQEMARSYAALTMCTLCRELRAALCASDQAG